MTNAESYQQLLNAYLNTHDLVNTSQPTVESIYGAELTGAVEELRRNILEAVASPPGSAPQVNAEENAVAAAEKCDGILGPALLNRNMHAEWAQHVNLVKSIVERWPRHSGRRR